MLKKITDFASLFPSSATLLCCAIPALLSVVAGGAAVSSFVSAFPWLIPLSENKNWLFLGAGALLAFNGVLTLRPKGTVACAITGGKGCEAAGGITKNVFWFAVILYGIGAFVAYALVPILIFLESFSG
jgi:mercuric ion transport protein